MAKVLRLVTLPPMTSAAEINIKNRIQAITFRNAGTSTVNLNYGGYTLDSKETLHIAAVDNNDEINLNGTQVSFDTTS